MIKIGKTYEIVMVMALAILSVFSYMSYYIYGRTIGTNYFPIFYIMLAPLFVSIILIVMLLVFGREAVEAQLSSA